MLERPASGERAVVVQIDFGQSDIEDQLEEVRLLTESAGGVEADGGGHQLLHDRLVGGNGEHIGDMGGQSAR